MRSPAILSTLALGLLLVVGSRCEAGNSSHNKGCDQRIGILKTRWLGLFNRLSSMAHSKHCRSCSYQRAHQIPHTRYINPNRSPRDFWMRR